MVTFEVCPSAPVRFHEYANLTRGDAAEILARKGCIYCIGDEKAEIIKLGWSSDPEKRLRELQCGNPTRLIIHAIFPASQCVERGLHGVFADLRMRGEWFDNSDNQVIDVISGLLDHFFPEAS